MRTKFNAFGWVFGSLSLVALVASACSAPPESEGSASDGDAASVAATSEAVVTAGCQASFNHGGSPSPQSFVVTVGCTVSPGFRRKTATAVNVAAGSCSISSWLYRNDPHSGQVNVNVSNDGGYSGGICTVTVFQEPDVPPCAHSMCVVAAPLRRDCSDDVTQLCRFDPFCCTSWWDLDCVTEATFAGLC